MMVFVSSETGTPLLVMIKPFITVVGYPTAFNVNTVPCDSPFWKVLLENNTSIENLCPSKEAPSVSSPVSIGAVLLSNQDRHIDRYYKSVADFYTQLDRQAPIPKGLNDKEQPSWKERIPKKLLRIKSEFFDVHMDFTYRGCRMASRSVIRIINSNSYSVIFRKMEPVTC